MNLLPPVLKVANKQRVKRGRRFTLSQYYDMCKKLFESQKGRAYIGRVDRLLLQQPFLPLMYMNFKSHNILSETARDKMFGLIARYQPSTMCLSEALVPIALAHKAHRRNKTVPIRRLDTLNDDVIVQPYRASHEFTEKKMTQYGGKAKRASNVWLSFFKALGYEYVVFASPADCPFGANWGNCVVTKRKPEWAHAIHLPSYGKLSMGAKESRCAIIVKFEGSTLVTVHLDNLNDDRRIRARQAKKLVKTLQRLERNITLCGDLNALYKESYSDDEWNVLGLLAHPSGARLPVDAVALLNKSRIFNNAQPLNAGQKYECLAQTCVTHVYSNTFHNTAMQFTDATDFDHQPIFVW